VLIAQQKRSDIRIQYLCDTKLIENVIPNFQVLKF
jgi:hypothetical protein